MDRERTIQQSRVLVAAGASADRHLIRLKQACALLEMQVAHRIRLVPEGDGGQCDGVLLVDGACSPVSDLPTLRVSDSSLRATVAALVDFAPKLQAVQEKREKEFALYTRATAALELTASERRHFRQAVETWQWPKALADLVLARGVRQARERRLLLAAGVPARDSLTSRFRWRDLEEELWDELGS